MLTKTLQNALDMIGSLQLQYNRGRQAVITNELIDIITVSAAERSLWIALLMLCLGCLCFVRWSVRNRYRAKDAKSYQK